MDPFRDFARSAGPTLGVEWEICLVDPETRDLVPRAAEVIDEVQARHPDIHLEPEFLQNTIELVTPICANTSEAIQALNKDLTAIKEVADEKGLKLWASGGHPFSDFRTNPLSPKNTYEEIVNRTQYWGQHMLLWGIHCHVGISHEDKVWPIINAVMTKYPHLLAISASSPGWDGIDTSYASNRTMLYQQLPTAGMPYQFQSWDEWVSFMRDQQTSGVINHTGSMHFDVRPAASSRRLLVASEMRTSMVPHFAAVVALTHCLIVHYDRMLERGAELPTLQQWHVAENKWRGARYGMDALVITNRDTDEAWVKDELQLLIDELTPVAADLGCVDELNLVREIIQRGAGYERQRAIYARTGDWKDVVDATCAEMWELTP